MVPNSAHAAAGKPEVNRANVVAALTSGKPLPALSKDSVELAAMHGHLLDGRLANVSWIMELPDTMSNCCPMGRPRSAA